MSYFQSTFRAVRGMEKRCSKCDTVRSQGEFRKHSGTKDGLQYHCKQCQDDYYWRSDRYRTKQRESTRERRAERQAVVNEFKAQGCQKCGYDRCLAAIDCHHVDEKDSLIPDLVKRRVSMTVLTKELERCVPLCARCHREFHAGY